MYRKVEKEGDISMNSGDGQYRLGPFWTGCAVFLQPRL
jgi:hypothetical protein